jgi:hypothetical protein
LNPPEFGENQQEYRDNWLMPAILSLLGAGAIAWLVYCWFG